MKYTAAEERILSTEEATRLVMSAATRIVPLAKARGNEVLGVYLCGSFARGEQGKREGGKYHALIDEELGDMVTEEDITDDERDLIMGQMDDALFSCGGTAFAERGSLENVTIACLKQHLPERVSDIAAKYLYSDIDAVFVFDAMRGHFDDIRKVAESINKYAYPHRFGLINLPKERFDRGDYSCGKNLIQGVELLTGEEVKELIKENIEKRMVTFGWVKK